MQLSYFKKQFQRKRGQVNKYLDQCLPSAGTFPGPIYQAMRYSLLAGGKRFRPILTILTAELLGGRMSEAMPVAAALEMIHTYSLIHDDLPVMDNDDFRRGRPTNHKVFGEAMAILAGDALLTMAFQLITDKVKNKNLAARLVNEIAKAAGPDGMVGGQVLDIFKDIKSKGSLGKIMSLSPGVKWSPDIHRGEKYVREIHQRKTAALIVAAVRVGALTAGARPTQLNNLTRYAQNLGLAFQVVDDLLDLKGSQGQLGKTPHKDTRVGKLTYPAVLGENESWKQSRDLITAAKKSLDPFRSRAEMLKALADYVLQRGN